MATRTLFTALALTALMAGPAMADDGHRRHSEGDHHNGAARASERAVPRNDVRPSENRRHDEVGDRAVARRPVIVRPAPVVVRPAPVIVRRAPVFVHARPVIVHPTIVRVIPYQPYVYRPSLSVGVVYGAGGAYPYGYTPRAYYDPIPGRPYGGVRITGAPRDAQVFADGYYVGIVNDFDGVFQHLNLEAGPHHIEVALDGYQSIAFDVYVRPGETTTFHADGLQRY